MVACPTDGASYAPAVVEILTSRVLLRPTDLGRSLRFYEQTVGLAIYREWGSGSSRGVVFFLGGGGLLELSGGGGRPVSDAVSLVLQVRDVHATYERLVRSGVTVQEEPELKPSTSSATSSVVPEHDSRRCFERRAELPPALPAVR